MVTARGDKKASRPLSSSHGAPPGVIYRRALPSDRAGIIALSNCFPDDWIPYVVDEGLSDPVGGFCVAEATRGTGLGGGRIVAVSSAGIAGESAWLEAMRVHPDWQGRGLATGLTRYLLTLSRRAGCRYARLATAVGNAPVHHFIGEKLGFRRLGEWLFHDDIEDFEPVDSPLPAGHRDIEVRAASLPEADGVWRFIEGQSQASRVAPPGLVARPSNPWRVEDFSHDVFMAYLAEGHVLVAAPRSERTRVVGSALCGVAVPGYPADPWLGINYLLGDEPVVRALMAAAVESGRRDARLAHLCLSLPWSQWEVVRKAARRGWPRNGHALEAVIYHREL